MPNDDMTNYNWPTWHMKVDPCVMRELCHVSSGIKFLSMTLCWILSATCHD
jgi:hypothetical protein